MIQIEETYEAIDHVKETMKASSLADYLWFNYPEYAEDLMEEINARLYLDTLKGE